MSWLSKQQMTTTYTVQAMCMFAELNTSFRTVENNLRVEHRRTTISVVLQEKVMEGSTKLSTYQLRGYFSYNTDFEANRL